MSRFDVSLLYKRINCDESNLSRRSWGGFGCFGTWYSTSAELLFCCLVGGHSWVNERPNARGIHRWGVHNGFIIPRVVGVGGFQRFDAFLPRGYRRSVHVRLLPFMG